MLPSFFGFDISVQLVLNVLGLMFVFLITWSLIFILASVSTDARERTPGDANAARIAKYNQVALASAMLSIPVALMALTLI
jgi:hypothetical protein